jgi:hypothetical protein
MFGVNFSYVLIILMWRRIKEICGCSHDLYGTEFCNGLTRYWCSRDPSVLYRSVDQKMLKIIFLHKDSRTDEKESVSKN